MCRDFEANCRNRTIDEAQRQFKAYLLGDTKAIHPNLRSAVFKINVARGGKQAYEAVKQEYITTTSIDGKEICLQSLGQVQSADLVEDFLDFQFSDHVAVQDTHSGSVELAANSEMRGVMWEWIKTNWKTVEKKLGGNSIVIDRYLKESLRQFASHSVEKDIALFFQGKNTKGYDRGLVEISDTVRGNANYKERDEQLVLEWLKAYQYA